MTTNPTPMGHSTRGRFIGHPGHLTAIIDALAPVLTLAGPRPVITTGRKGDHLVYFDVVGIKDDAVAAARRSDAPGITDPAPEPPKPRTADLTVQTWMPLAPGDVVLHRTGTYLAVDEPGPAGRTPELRLVSPAAPPADTSATGSGEPVDLDSRFGSDLTSIRTLWADAHGQLTVVRGGTVIHAPTHGPDAR